MPTTIKITEWFGANLAQLLADKIKPVYPAFDDKGFIKAVGKHTAGKTYTQRIEVIADELHNFLPRDYTKAVAVLMQILGPENPSETGMFTNFYWLMPVGKFIEKYGLDDFGTSMQAIGEVTKRNTGEYAVRPFLRKYPKQGLRQMKIWAKSDNFHLRRLASEGLRPKLPWAPKLEEFIEHPQPVFEVLEILKEEPVKFVQKSVANHLTDYLKVNPEPTRALMALWRKSDNPNTQWIIRHATRKLS
ncbi:MAG: DNA alkylation repair protein [Candidatus Saccharimonadales bacterium]